MRLKASSISLFPLFISSIISLQGFCQNKYKVEGRIIDFDSKQPLKNISVIIRETKNGVVTNDSGYFSITARTLHFTLLVSAVGYVHYTRPLEIFHDTSFNIELKKKANEELDEVVVNAYRENAKVKTVEMNTLRINPEQIKRSPLLFGEADIIKALILQPGVSSAGEGAGGFNVRGGNTDENLVLIDGAPLFNTSHLIGFYTSISPDAIQDLTLYKGGMPAQYGGRLSSLLNMKIKAGNNNHMQYTGGIGPVSARFFANGPVIKNKLTMTGGFRVAYPDLILNQFPGKFGASRAFFYDGILKGEYSLNANNKIALMAYRSYDKFKFDTSTVYDWQTNVVSLNESSAISSKLTLKINAGYSGFISGINELEQNYQFRLRSSIEQKQIKAALLYAANDKNKIELGADYINYIISPGTKNPTSPSSNINPVSIQKENGREVAAYVNDEIDFTEKISLQAGLRYTFYEYLGPKKVYAYETGVPLSKETITDTISYPGNKNIQSYGGLEPRISLKIGITDDLSVKLSYNRGQQFLHLISNTTSISPVDFWKLSDQYNKRETGDQYAAGFFRNFANSQYELSIEAYYKTTKNIVEYKDGAQLLLNPYIESALLNARGRAYGIEFSFIKSTGKFTGQINYTYSRSQVQVITDFPSEKVNGGAYYPSNIDMPHNLAILTRLKLGRGWSFNSNFIFISGRPATYPDGNYSFNSTLVTNYSRRNKDRLPAYHRLDAGFSYVSKRFAGQKKYSVWNFSFYNLYMHQNAYSIYFNRDQDVLKSYRLSVVGGIIPSISWNFYF